MSLLSQILGNWSLIVSTLVGAAIGMYIVDDEYLLSGEAPNTDSINLKIAFFGGEEDITDAMVEEVKRFAAYVKEREKNDNGDNKSL